LAVILSAAFWREGSRECFIAHAALLGFLSKFFLGSPLLPRKISDFAFSFWTFHWQLATGRWQLLHPAI